MTPIILQTPTPAEAMSLLGSPPVFRDFIVGRDAAPPAFLIERALRADDGGWSMPRLFCHYERHQIVGSGVFKTPPTLRRVEIGYGVAQACAGLGYATAGVKLLVAEAFATGEIDEVAAETAISNRASQRVLEKVGFVRNGSVETDEGTMFLWLLRRIG